MQIITLCTLHFTFDFVISLGLGLFYFFAYVRRVSKVSFVLLYQICVILNFPKNRKYLPTLMHRNQAKKKEAVKPPW